MVFIIKFVLTQNNDNILFSPPQVAGNGVCYLYQSKGEYVIGIIVGNWK